jgi:hypothetical protein
MRTASRTSVFLVAAAVIALLSPLLQAAPIAPLPQFFVTGINGQPSVNSSTFVRPGNWMLVIVRPDCLPCDKVLSVMSEMNAGPSLVVIVAGTDATGGAAYAARYPELASARWYVDPTHETSSLSPLRAAPLMFGLRANMQRWSLAGIVPDLDTVRAALLNWVG